MVHVCARMSIFYEVSLLNVCFVGRDVHPPWISGEPAITRGLINCLQGNQGKLRLSLITTIDATRCHDTKGLTDFIKRLDDYILMQSSRNYYSSSIVLWRGLAKLTERKNIDIIHMISVCPFIFAPLSRLIGGTHRPKFVRHILMPYFQSEGSLRYAINPIRRAFYSKFVDDIVVTSPLTKKWLIKLNILGKNKRIFVIPPPLDCEFFKPLTHRQKTGLFPPDCDYRILYIGPMSPARFPVVNVLETVKILKKNGLNVNLLVLARGTEFDYLWVNTINKRATKMGLNKNVTACVKTLSEEEKLDYYNSADSVIFPWTRSFVGAVEPPLTLLEAMSCGKIVVASKVEGITQIVEHDTNGILVDIVSADKFAEGITHALTLKKTNRIQINARQTIINRFSNYEIRKRLLCLYSDKN